MDYETAIAEVKERIVDALTESRIEERIEAEDELRALLDARDAARTIRS